MSTKTRADIKWLINEIASLKGDLVRMDKQATELAARQAATARSHAACVRTLALIVDPGKQEELPSTLAEYRMPTVNAKRPYGGWGSLRGFVREMLRLRAPAPLDTLQIALLAAEELHTTFATLDEFERFKDNSVGNVLRYFRKMGLVEYAGEEFGKRGRPALWRWRESLQTLGSIVDAAKDNAGHTEGGSSNGA